MWWALAYSPPVTLKCTDWSFFHIEQWCRMGSRLRRSFSCDKMLISPSSTEAQAFRAHSTGNKTQGSSSAPSLSFTGLTTAYNLLAVFFLYLRVCTLGCIKRSIMTSHWKIKVVYLTSCPSKMICLNFKNGLKQMRSSLKGSYTFRKYGYFFWSASSFP